MINPALFSSKSSDWETPQDLYDALNEEFGFTCDVAANAENAKHVNYIDEQQDALIVPWEGVCWCNPPYSRKVWRWLAKAHEETFRGVTTVMLLPARTSNEWFHRYVYNKYPIRFIRGRLQFVGAKSSAPFPSMVVIFQKQ